MFPEKKLFLNVLQPQMDTASVSDKRESRNQLTIASFVAADESFPTGFFCFGKLPAFTAGVVTRRREGSAPDQPLVLPSSPPGTMLKKILPFEQKGIRKCMHKAIQITRTLFCLEKPFFVDEK